MASRYWVGGHPTNNNWNQTGSGTTNWSATSGGAAGASVPGASDNVIFDGNGNSASTISATITVLSFTVVSGYTSTITHNAVLTVAGNVTLTTGYTIAGSLAITISAASTITSGGQTWPNGMNFNGTNTKTLSDNLVIGGTLAINGVSTVINATTAETLTCAGITVSQATSGTAKIILSGGTWLGTAALQNDLDIAGNVTVSGSVAFNTKTLTYISGTVTTTGSTLTIAASTTLNTAGITWNNISNSASATLTINSLLSVGGTMTLANSNSITFDGTSGFTAATVDITNISGKTLTLNDGVTYTITNAFTANTSRLASILTITSDHASNRAILTLQQGATCNVLANFTRIDASAGRAILTFNGTVTDCVNVFSYNDVKWKPVTGEQRGSRRLKQWNKNRAVEYR